jgi:hypothetical protein
MHHLLVALPDPMVLEATLPMPTTTVSIHHTHNLLASARSSIKKHLEIDGESDGLLLGSDGEPWLPDDPFHSFEGPAAFWAEEQVAPTFIAAAYPETEALDVDVETTHLVPDLLDSPLRDELTPPPPIQSLCNSCVVQPPLPLIASPPNIVLPSIATTPPPPADLLTPNTTTTNDAPHRHPQPPLALHLHTPLLHH